NDATTAQKKAWAQYFYDNDPYHHHIVIHNMGNPHHDLLGPGSKLTGFSLQTSKTDFSQVHDRVKDYLKRSVDAGKSWAVACDEPGDASHALRPDNDAGNSHTDGRKNALWGTFLAGGWGNEWYFGYQHDHSDLTCEDWRSRDAFWDYCRYALEFFNNNNIPFWQMTNADSIISTSGDYCLALDGEVYVILLKNGGSTDLDLSAHASSFDVEWFDPRNGGSLQSKSSIDGGSTVPIGPPPSSTSSDWVALVTTAGSLSGVRAIISATPTSGEAPLPVSFNGSQSTGDNLSYSWDFGDPSSSSNTATGATAEHTYETTGQYSATLTVTSGTVSRSSSETISVIGLRTADDPSPVVSGLDYSYYEGTWTNLPDFSTLTAASSGTMNNFDISSFTSLNYGVIFTGYVEVPQDGEYTFTTSSNDGSKLYIGDSLIVDNDGTHTPQEASGTIGLKAGKHAITVEYFQAGRTQALDVFYDGPGTGGKVAIPDNALFRMDQTTVLNISPARIAANQADRPVLFDIRGKRIMTTSPDTRSENAPLPQGVYFRKKHMKHRIIVTK
ncbi:MAG: PKD domain-containing protein, partial [Chitinivibrionales bacterium]|nr:PKD domain-containing protein [Chitinivibrionales bacterium]